MTPVELGDLLRFSTLDDVLVAGFIDDDEDPVGFHGVLTAAYLDFAGVLIEIRAAESDGTLVVTPVAQVRHHFELDESMRPAVASIQEIVIEDPDGDCAVTVLRLWDAGPGDGHISCSAFEVDLASGQELFVDPTFHFGLRIGGGKQRRNWSSNWPGAKCATESVLDLRM